MWCPPQLCLLVYKPHEYHSYLRIINYSYWSYVHQLSYLGGLTLIQYNHWFINPINYRIIDISLISPINHRYYHRFHEKNPQKVPCLRWMQRV